MGEASVARRMIAPRERRLAASSASPTVVVGGAASRDA